MRILLILFLLLPVLSLAQEEIHESRLSPFVSDDDSTRFIYDQIIYYQGSSTGLDPHYQYTLDNLFEEMVENLEWTLHIRGHVCCGPAEKVSAKRAKVVYEYFIDRGLSPDRVTYAGYSDRMPLAFPEKTTEDEETNRRVDFMIHR